jgi:alkylated DNA repair dioxygenase AlkB
MAFLSTVPYKKLLTQTTFISSCTLPKELHLKREGFEALWSLRPTEEQYVWVAGNRVAIPRKQKAYGISYQFSGQTSIADPIPSILQPYLDYTNTISPGNNMILVNWYTDGDEYIGFHADDERQLVPDSNIFIVSFGAERTFRLKENTTGKNRL